MNKEPCIDSSVCKTTCGVKCFFWSPIVIGTLFAIGLSFLLNLFSTAIGLSIYNVGADGITTLTVGGMVGFAIGIIAIMFFSGWIAGHLGKTHCETKTCGAIYGFSTWCLSLVLMILLASSFSKFMTSYSNQLTNTVTTVAVSSMTTHTQVALGNEQAVNDLGKSTFVIFLMFFLGAIASTCGGYAGVRSCCSSECCPDKTSQNNRS